MWKELTNHNVSENMDELGDRLDVRQRQSGGGQKHAAMKPLTVYRCNRESIGVDLGNIFQDFGLTGSLLFSPKDFGHHAIFLSVREFSSEPFASDIKHIGGAPFQPVVIHLVFVVVAGVKFEIDETETIVRDRDFVTNILFI
jgi:hypothetical protein